jgi:Transglutaminase-like superfamily
MPNLQTFRGVLSQPLPHGDDGVAKTIAMIRDVVDAGVTDPFVNETAIRILQNAGVGNFDREAKLRALYEFVSWPNFLYVEDPVGPFGPKETIRTGRTLLQLKAGDCDDYTVLLSALAGTIGISTRAVTVAADPSLPSDFSHIYPEAEVSPGFWVPMDAARPGAEFGLPALRYFRKRIWSLTDSSYRDIAGTMRGDGCKCCHKAPQRMSSLNGYAVLGSGVLGDDTSAQDISAIGQATANILAAAQGSPYGSFQTAYTPVAPYAAYPANSLSLTGSNSWMWILGIGAVALALARR